MSVTKKTLYWTIAGVIVAVVGVAVAIKALSEPKTPTSSTSQTGSGNVANSTVGVSLGNNGCVAIGGQCVLSTSSDPESVRQALSKLPNASAPPAGKAPWMFVVVGTGTLGLYVRDGYGESNHRLPGNPTIAEGLAVYVDCRVLNGWNADPSTTANGLWYKIRYPQVANSGNYWVYGGYLQPVGQNGGVPLCRP
jgi:hypothetical protein